MDNAAKTEQRAAPMQRTMAGNQPVQTEFTRIPCPGLDAS